MKKQKTFIGFLDLSKAFDSVDRDQLFNSLYDIGIQGKVFSLIRALYEKVDSRVIFGSFESDTFEVVAGVKQGCILSPCLFNLVMLDLERMLSNCQGITVGNKKVQGLFYADDITLIANSKEDLSDMLSVTDKFGKKWGLSFNDSKSQIMVIGQKTNTNIRWMLGDKALKETNSYKYLGVIISRRLNDSLHISKHLSEKADNLASYIRFTLSTNLDVQRCQLGNTLWHNVALPALSHASGIWFNNSNTTSKCLNSAQYKCAKAILKLHSMPARIATLRDLNWLPISDHLNVSRLKYFYHLCSLDKSRFTRFIFDALWDQYTSGVNEPFPYFTSIRDIFINLGIDHIFSIEQKSCTKSIQSLATDLAKNRFNNEIQDYSSLELYQSLMCDESLVTYTQSHRFKPVQLKFIIRTGTLGLGADLRRQHRGDGLCKCGNFESLKHFIFVCPLYNSTRLKMYKAIHNVNNDMLSDILANWDVGIAVFLGDHDNVFNDIFLTFMDEAWHIRCNS